MLDQVRAILGDSTTDFWDEVNPEQRASIERGINQAENGETKSHEEVMKAIKAM